MSDSSHNGKPRYAEAMAGGMLLWGCAVQQDPLVDANTPVPGQECAGSSCVGASALTDWTAQEPTFAAHFQVVDAAGRPIGGATVRTGDLSKTTDRSGFVQLGPLPAGSPLGVNVEKDGYTPHATLTDVFESGRQPAHVVLTPVGVVEAIVLGEPAIVSHQGASLRLEPQALIAEDGSRPLRGTAEMTQFLPEAVPEAALPKSLLAVDATGAPTVMEPPLSVTHLHFESEGGEPLNLAPGQSASLQVPLPQAAQVAVGDQLAMWNLNETDHRWHEEGTCTVLTRGSGDDSGLVCVGSVTHFSIWAIAKEYDIYRPNALGCINADVLPEEGACFRVWVEREVLLACDAEGNDCNPARTHGRGYYVRDGELSTTLSEISADRQVSYCGVVKPGTYRAELTYRVDASACSAEEAPLSGRRTMLTEPLDLSSFAEMLGQELMLNFTLNGQRDCPTLCAQAQFIVDAEALRAPTWIDQDGDGAWVSLDPEAVKPLGADVDCDDTDRFVHPRAYEPFCATVDMNCDGRVPTEPTALSELPDYKWNWDCRACLADGSVGPPLSRVASSLQTEEVAGNRYDEDCDGRIGDRDGDGYSAPEDCNDFNADISPDHAEIVGNAWDDDCDGIVLDADGDGVLSRHLTHFAESILSDFPDFDLQSFADCDDLDRRAYPDAPLENERGQLSSYYYQGRSGIHRSVGYCSLFYQSGEPNGLFYRLVRDRNCDGKLTDVDGDGLTLPGDHSLGEAAAVDCDDLDPRVGAGTWDEETDTLHCDPDAAASRLLNDSICQVSAQSYEPGTTCPVLTLNGNSLMTMCEEATDLEGNGTGFGVCSFDGWWNTNPLSVHPGELYGPCDMVEGEAQLPCNKGLVCAGLPPSDPRLAERSAWTPAFSHYVSSTYLDGTEVAGQGMCFPACVVESSTEE